MQHRVKGIPIPDPWPWADLGNVTSHTITGLENGTTYFVRLRSFNEADSSTVVKKTATPSSTSARSLSATAAPSVSEAPGDLTLEAGETRTLDVASTFTGQGLTYAASATDGSVVSAAVAGGELTVTGLARGTTTLYVTARNDAGSAGYSLAVTVKASAAERAAYESVFAAVGRSLLSARGRPWRTASRRLLTSAVSPWRAGAWTGLRPACRR